MRMSVVRLMMLAWTIHSLAGTKAPVFGLVSNRDLGIIRKGGLYVEHHWLDAEELTTLQQDIANLAANEYFLRSGLSNRIDGDTNSFGLADRLTCTITENLPGGANRERVENKLDTLRLRLQRELGMATLELAEHYYSISPTGSSLPRHMDERHEETKGNKAWEVETRRSISWLLYLNDSEWHGGGELRAYCRESSGCCGAHEGNLQVGWLPSGTGYQPVFLDSWVKTPVDKNSSAEGVLQWKPLSALYLLSDTEEERDYLSDPFGPDSPSWPSNKNLNPDEFAAALASQLYHAESFSSVESMETVSPIDILPTGGTLVLFDSVTVPHEVLVTTNGERCAMAGWFHEPSQAFPDWYGT